MRKIKWIFFGYLAVVVLVAAGIAVSFAKTSPRDPRTLYLTYASNLKSLDPAVCNDNVGGDILGNIYECLYNYKYGVKPYQLFPQLAEDLPETSPDGLTITIKLRKGIRFYDTGKEAFPDGAGPEMTARDVVFSWKRIADFNLGSPNYSTLFQDKIVGLDKWNSYTEQVANEGGKVDFDRPVEGLEALDDYTIRIKLAQPSPQFRYLMAYLGSAVVSRKGVEFYGDRFKFRPVGTGPYVLKEHLPEQRIVFERNPSYRGRPDVDGGAPVSSEERLPKISRIRYDYFQEPMPVWYLFLQGLYDSTGISKDTYTEAIDPDTLELRPAMAAAGINLTKAPDPFIFYYGFNMNDPVVGKNKPLRQAMSMAYDRAKYIRIYQNGRGVSANGPIPPGFRTYDPKRVNHNTDFDVAGAIAKVREAEQVNHGKIPPITLLMGSTDTEARQEAEFFISQMKAIGLEVKADYNTWARFQERVDARETQLFGLGWVPDYPDEQTFLQLFYGKFAPAGGINPTAYINPDYDALYEKAMVMNEGPERDVLYRRMADIVCEDCPWICNFYPMNYSLRHEWLSPGKLMDYGSGMLQFRSLDVDRRAAALRKG